jgi:hypothetical protein
VSAEPALLGTWTRGQIFCTILNVSSRREQQAIHFSGCQAYRFPFVGEAIPDRKKEKIARALRHQQTIFNERGWPASGGAQTEFRRSDFPKSLLFFRQSQLCTHSV